MMFLCVAVYVCVCKLFISSNHVDGVTCRYFAHRRELRQLSLHCETIYQFRDVIRICTHITHLRSPGSTGINPIALQKSLVSSHYPSPHTCVLMCGFQPSDTHKKNRLPPHAKTLEHSKKIDSPNYRSTLRCKVRRNMLLTLTHVHNCPIHFDYLCTRRVCVCTR